MTDDGSAATLSLSGLEAPPPSKAVLPLRKTGTDAYVELHARSAFSFLEGASLPEELISRCAELDQPAIALADAQGVYGAPRFHMASKKAGIRALIGAEVASPEGCRYTLLAENRQGYQNLCCLITRIKLREGRQGSKENQSIQWPPKMISPNSPPAYSVSPAELKALSPASSLNNTGRPPRRALKSNWRG